MTPETAIPGPIQEYYLGQHRRRAAALARVALGLVVLGVLPVIGSVVSALLNPTRDEVKGGLHLLDLIVSLAFLFVCAAVGLALALHSRRLTPSRLTRVAIGANAAVLVLIGVVVAIALRA